MAYLNGSKDGYDKGFADGLAGRPKNPVPLTSALSQAVRPEAYTASFLDGYSEGWRDGNRKRNNV